MCQGGWQASPTADPSSDAPFRGDSNWLELLSTSLGRSRREREREREIYIYIYICRERERETEGLGFSVSRNKGIHVIGLYRDSIPLFHTKIQKAWNTIWRTL